jgi:hypothetical protein
MGENGRGRAKKGAKKGGWRLVFCLFLNHTVS